MLGIFNLIKSGLDVAKAVKNKAQGGAPAPQDSAEMPGLNEAQANWVKQQTANETDPYQKSIKQQMVYQQALQHVQKQRTTEERNQLKAAMTYQGLQYKNPQDASETNVTLRKMNIVDKIKSEGAKQGFNVDAMDDQTVMDKWLKSDPNAQALAQRYLNGDDTALSEIGVETQQTDPTAAAQPAGTGTNIDPTAATQAGQEEDNTPEWAKKITDLAGKIQNTKKGFWAGVGDAGLNLLKLPVRYGSQLINYMTTKAGLNTEEQKDMYNSIVNDFLDNTLTVANADNVDTEGAGYKAGKFAGDTASLFTPAGEAGLIAKADDALKYFGIGSKFVKNVLVKGGVQGVADTLKYKAADEGKLPSGGELTAGGIANIVLNGVTKGAGGLKNTIVQWTSDIGEKTMNVLKRTPLAKFQDYMKIAEDNVLNPMNPKTTAYFTEKAKPLVDTIKNELTRIGEKIGSVRATGKNYAVSFNNYISDINKTLKSYNYEIKLGGKWGASLVPLNKVGELGGSDEAFLQDFVSQLGQVANGKFRTAGQLLSLDARLSNTYKLLEKRSPTLNSMFKKLKGLNSQFLDNYFKDAGVGADYFADKKAYSELATLIDGFESRVGDAAEGQSFVSKLLSKNNEGGRGIIEALQNKAKQLNPELNNINLMDEAHIQNFFDRTYNPENTAMGAFMKVLRETAALSPYNLRRSLFDLIENGLKPTQIQEAENVIRRQAGMEPAESAISSKIKEGIDKVGRTMTQKTIDYYDDSDEQ